VTDRVIFQVGHIERVPLGTPYPGVVAHVGRLLEKLPGRAELVIDFTGVGRPVFDMFTYSGIYPQGVLITGHLTFNARSGRHDDLVLALAIAVWRAHGGGMAHAGLFEWTRRQALGLAATDPRYYVGLDLGQSRDPTAIAVVRRLEPAPPPPPGRPEPAYAEGSVEWTQQQEKLRESAAELPAAA
jgi:hypothetical protein